jgi:dihydrofolate reductase
LTYPVTAPAGWVVRDEFGTQAPASTTLQAPEWQNTTVINGDVAERVAELKRQPGKNISVNGSATLVRSLVGTGLIDELHLFVMPVLVGSGARFPETGDEVALELTNSRAYGNGVVSLTYAPSTQ